MKNNKLKSIREWVLMLIMVVLILLTCYVPSFSVIGMFACGIPMACFAVNKGWKSSVIALIGVFIITFLITESLLSTVSIMLMSVLPGVVAGVCLGKNTSFFTTLFITCLAVCAGWMFGIFVIDKFSGNGGIDALVNATMGEFRKSLELTMANLPVELKADELEKVINEAVEMTIYTIKLYFPSIVVITSMITGYVIVKLCGFFIRKLKFKEVYTLSFSMMKAPKSMSFAAVILYMISVFGDKNGSFWAVCANVVLILYTIIGICGLSFLDNKFSKVISRGGLRILVYLALFLFLGALMPIILNILVIVGILDSSYNFRKISGDGTLTDGGDGGGLV